MNNLNFFQQLYSSNNPSPIKINQFLNRLTFPELNQYMNSLFYISEICEVFNIIQNRKSFSPDVSGEFYKEFKVILISEFLFLCNTLYQGDPLTEFWKQSKIILILKLSKVLNIKL